MHKFDYMSDAYDWCVKNAVGPCSVLDNNGLWAEYLVSSPKGAGLFADYGVVGGYTYEMRKKGVWK